MPATAAMPAPFDLPGSAPLGGSIETPLHVGPPLVIEPPAAPPSLPDIYPAPLAGLPPAFVTHPNGVPLEFPRVEGLPLPRVFALPLEIAPPSFAAFSLDRSMFSPEVVPEPASGLLVVLGLAGLAASRRRA